MPAWRQPAGHAGETYHATHAPNSASWSEMTSEPRRGGRDSNCRLGVRRRSALVALRDHKRRAPRRPEPKGLAEQTRPEHAGEASSLLARPAATRPATSRRCDPPGRGRSCTSVSEVCYPRSTQSTYAERSAPLFSDLEREKERTQVLNHLSTSNLLSRDVKQARCAVCRNFSRHDKHTEFKIAQPA